VRSLLLHARLTPQFAYDHAEMPLNPPPERSYDTLEQVEQAVLAHARGEGYRIVAKRTNYYDKRVRKEIRSRDFTCDKYSEPRTSNVLSTRNTGSCKCSCKMAFEITHLPLDERWQAYAGGHDIRSWIDPQSCSF